MSSIDLTSRRRDFRGDLVGPADPGYDDARRIYNGGIDRRPALIARCADAADVAAAIALAREFDFPLAVRAGGHGVAGHAICEGGVVVDLTRMRRVEVAPDALVVRVEGGARLMDLDAACAPHDLVTPAGVVGTTGVAGLTLGGGLGHLLGPLGFTCDSLLAAEVVTADGSRVRTSQDEDPELLWGLRGAGGNFGVVTRFEFRLHPLETPDGGPLRYGRDGVASGDQGSARNHGRRAGGAERAARRRAGSCGCRGAAGPLPCRRARGGRGGRAAAARDSGRHRRAPAAP